MKVFIPANDHNIAEGYYDQRGIVALLRRYKASPAAVQFIADMLESNIESAWQRQRHLRCYAR